MGRVVRLILVSRELSLEDLSLLKQRLPSGKDFSTYCVWEYDNNNVDEKWARFDMTAMSLADYVRQEEDR